MTKTIIVSGLGRCGSSLTMQMLEAAGVRMNGEYPAFEGSISSLFTRGAATGLDWALCEGKATKILCAADKPLPALSVPLSVLWLYRDKREQARSQAKMPIMLNGFPQPSRTHMRHWSASITQEDRVCQRRWRALGAQVFTLSYEDLINQPLISATRIDNALELAADVATLRAMAACVRKSDPRCSADLSMEAGLIEERDGRVRA